jgi:hypothetical protein
MLDGDDGTLGAERVGTGTVDNGVALGHKNLDEEPLLDDEIETAVDHLSITPAPVHRSPRTSDSPPPKPLGKRRNAGTFTAFQKGSCFGLFSLWFIPFLSTALLMFLCLSPSPSPSLPPPAILLPLFIL